MIYIYRFAGQYYMLTRLNGMQPVSLRTNNAYRFDMICAVDGILLLLKIRLKMMGIQDDE